MMIMYMPEINLSCQHHLYIIFFYHLSLITTISGSPFSRRFLISASFQSHIISYCFRAMIFSYSRVLSGSFYRRWVQGAPNGFQDALGGLIWKSWRPRTTNSFPIRNLVLHQTSKRLAKCGKNMHKCITPLSSSAAADTHAFPPPAARYAFVPCGRQSYHEVMTVKAHKKQKWCRSIMPCSSPWSKRRIIFMFILPSWTSGIVIPYYFYSYSLLVSSVWYLANMLRSGFLKLINCSELTWSNQAS